MKLNIALAAAAAVLAIEAPATAATMDLATQVTNDGVGFYTVDLNFVLPTGFSNAVLTTSQFTADDRAVAQLNGATFTNTGIFGPGDGAFSFDGATFVPFTFTNGNGTDTDSIATGFQLGTNILHFIVNNTNDGIYGSAFTGGPSNISYTGTLTYSVGAVPEPATWALMIGGFGMVGGAMRRRTRSVRVARA